MATLYTHADSNVRKTWILLACFIVFIVILGGFLSYLLNDNIFLIVAVILSTVQGFSSFWCSDKIILSMVGANPIEKRDNPELYRIVENLSITAGLPAPKIYITEEAQPNAFTTGRDEKHAIIVVTRGLLDKLERTELEGVIAHEMAHIGNRDILLGTIVVVLVGIIVMLSRMFLRAGRLNGRRRKRDSKNHGGLLLILGLIGAVLAPIAASLIQLAISRKREFLADATGALLTRYPEGLAMALQKISQDDTPLRKIDNSTAHLYISNPLKGGNGFSKLFLTHPPTEERIRALRGMEIK